MGILFCHPGTICPWAAARGHVWVSNPDSDVVVCVDVHVTTNGPTDAHEAELSLPVTMVVSGGCAPMGSMPI